MYISYEDADGLSIEESASHPRYFLKPKCLNTTPQVYEIETGIKIPLPLLILIRHISVRKYKNVHYTYN